MRTKADWAELGWDDGIRIMDVHAGREMVSSDASVAPETWEFPAETGCVIVRQNVETLFYLNATATVVWNAYRKAGLREQAADELTRHFRIPRERAIADVTATLRDWTSAGLLGPLPSHSKPSWDGKHGEPIVIACCSIEGTSFLLVTDSVAVFDEVGPRLDGVRVHACSPDVTFAVWACGENLFALIAGDELISVEEGVQAARAVLFQELVLRARPGREWLALLHAAACGVDGSCVLFPASSFSGKSTLAAALMATGFDLYSDDFVGIEVSGMQIPAMPFALAIREGSWEVLRNCFPAIEQLKAAKTLGSRVKFMPISGGELVPATAVALVFSEWHAGAAVSIQTLALPEVLSRLNTSGFWVRHDKVQIDAFLAWLERIPKFALRYGDLAQAVEQVRSILNQPHVVCGSKNVRS